MKKGLDCIIKIIEKIKNGIFKDIDRNECHDFDSCKDLIEYTYFQNTRLCTSKRPNKNYFDYLKYSISINESCKTGTKKCGKLDVKRILCVEEIENFPINNIVYNDKPSYTNNNITYNSIKMN